MQIDSITLSDLEIFDSPDGTGGVFELIDCTATSIGRRALRRRLSCPATDIARIREAQASVRFLQVHGSIICFDDHTIQIVDRYLRSNIERSVASGLKARVDQVWLRLRYPDLLQELLEGQVATIALFREIRAFCQKLEDLDAPRDLAVLAASLRATADHVLNTANESSYILPRDRRLRGDLKDAILDAIRMVGELDAFNSMAISTSKLGWCMPTLVESDGFLLEAEGVFHPFVSDPVRNPARLSGGEPMVFLTGPNMAGKTTYLRSVALVVLLAQTGMGVPAISARLTPVEALFTSLNPSDNLKAGLSYFLAEILRVKAAATLLAQGTKALLLFDEVFKGTNVKDALEASAEVILGFARARNSGFIFSSHLAELVDVLEDSPAIRFCYFDGEVDQGSPRFGYTLKDGVSDKRFGMLLLRQANIPELIARISA